ncbi:MAG TPA: universal stress protein [Streptosporangiaceae bacterium]|nr:universal stress protein [Streptosporangiaceae bacterium]
MSKTILLAVDTTSHTAAAADMVRDLAAATGDRVVVLHVHEFAVGRFGRIQVDCGDGEGEKVAAEIVDRLTGAGVDAQADIRKTPVGHIARTISGVADEMDVRMIVLGSGSAHDVPRLPFGSVSLRLLHTASTPVLIVPKSLAPAPEPATTVAAGPTS